VRKFSSLVDEEFTQRISKSAALLCGLRHRLEIALISLDTIVTILVAFVA